MLPAVRKLLVAGLTNGKVLATGSLSLLYPSRDAKFTRAFDETLSQQGRDVGSPSSWTGRCNAMSGPDASLGEMPGFLFLAGPAASWTGRCRACSAPGGNCRRMRGIGCMRWREWLPAWPARRGPPGPEGTPGTGECRAFVGSPNAGGSGDSNTT